MDETISGVPQTLRERLAKLAEFCSAFEAEGFQFGKWSGRKPVSPGTIEMPYFELSASAAAFEQHCYQNGWVQQDFDWPEWSLSAEAVALRDDPPKLAHASADQLAKLLILSIRQERFCDGSLTAAHNSGLLLAILRRARDLAAVDLLNETPRSVEYAPARLAASADTLYLVACVGAKLPDPALAKDLYISDWFVKVRHYVERAGAPWFILSAEYGLVGSEEVLAPYECTLNSMRVAERRAWARRVRGQMESLLPTASRIVIFAGVRYREYLMDYLRSRAATVDVPLRGLGIGKQLAWLKKAEMT
jgi:hypothetical protein